MDSENPFEVSDSCSGVSQAVYSFENPNEFRVEGNILVCGRTVVLPRVCVLDRADHNLVARTKLVQFPSMRPVLMHRSCSVTYFLDKSYARRRLAFVAASVVSFIAAPIFFAIRFAEPQSPFALGIIFFLLTAAASIFISWLRDPVRLRLVNYQAPGVYRIRGFSPSYLNAINRLGSDLPAELPSKEPK